MERERRSGYKRFRLHRPLLHTLTLAHYYSGETFAVDTKLIMERLHLMST